MTRVPRPAPRPPAAGRSRPATTAAHDALRQIPCAGRTARTSIPAPPTAWNPAGQETRPHIAAVTATPAQLAPGPARPTKLYVREDHILSHLPALAILLSSLDDGAGHGNTALRESGPGHSDGGCPRSKRDSPGDLRFVGVRRRVTYRIWFATTRPGGVSCSHWACTGWAGTTPAKPTTSPSCNPSARTGAGQPLRLGTDLPGNAASPDPGPATALASWTQPTATAAIPIADTLRPALYLSFCRAAKYPALAGISRYDIPAWARRACPCGQSPSGPEVVAVPAISGNGFARDATAHWVVAARGALVDRQDPPRLGAGRRPGSANDPPGDSAKHKRGGAAGGTH